MQVPSDCSQKVQFRFAIIAAAVFVSKQKDIYLCCRCRLAFSNILRLFKIYTDFAFCAVGKVRSQQQFGVFALHTKVHLVFAVQLQLGLNFCTASRSMYAQNLQKMAKGYVVGKQFRKSVFVCARRRIRLDKERRRGNFFDNCIKRTTIFARLITQ